MSKNDTPEIIEVYPENKEQENCKTAHYGTPLVMVNTLILLCLLILGLSYKKDFTGEVATQAHAESVHEITQKHDSSYKEKESEKQSKWVTPHISRQAKIHILYGDETGGAHYHTVTTPCKSLFPKDWTPEKIIAVTEKIAANDNLQWNARKNGNMYAQETHDGIIVRVIMDAMRDYVITSYPLNATRNPCPEESKNRFLQKSDKQGNGSLFGDIEIEHKYNHND